MVKNRLIPILLLQNGMLVRSERFQIHQVIGNPLHEVTRFNEWNVDELIYLDITRDDHYDVGRNDHRVKDLTSPLAILSAVSERCFMPLTWGGRINRAEQMHELFRHGADKISLNTAAVRTPELISEGARIFGNQAIVVSIDVLRHPDNRCEVFIDGGRTATGKDPVSWAREVEDRGAGEILMQQIDRDGTGMGYDTEMIHAVASTVSIPLIACSGVGVYEHYAAGIRAGASAVAAANIWHFKELSDRGGKRALARANINVRI